MVSHKGIDLLFLEENLEEEKYFSIFVEYDGPGLTEDKIDKALKRGWWFDESKPGAGLGLAIVSDMVNEYGGTLFYRVLSWGLCTKVLLPKMGE